MITKYKEQSKINQILNNKIEKENTNKQIHLKINLNDEIEIKKLGQVYKLG
jgi:hypothetical protein